MPYTDFINSRLPMTAQETSILTRFAIILVFLLLLPMLLFSQSTFQATTFASLGIDASLGGLSNPPGDQPVQVRHAMAKPAPVITTTRAIAAVTAFPTIDTRSLLPSREKLAQEASAAQTSDLRTFSGARIRDVIQLTWNTVSDAGIIGFEIERRSQRNSHWEQIGYLRPADGRRNGDSYTFLDNLCGDGAMYYRLRQIRSSGEATVSPVVQVTPDEVLQSFEIWRHSLQPFRNYGTVSFGLTSDADVKLTILDRYGNTVATLLDYRHMEEGHHIIPFGMEKFAPGLYILRIHTDTQSRNLILLHS